MDSIVKNEKEGVKLQTEIKNLLGRPATKQEALEALQLHRDGDGGNTVGWKFDEKVNIRMVCSWEQHTLLGDALIDLGRLAKKEPRLKWCFPESYKEFNKDVI